MGTFIVILCNKCVPTTSKMNNLLTILVAVFLVSVVVDAKPRGKMPKKEWDKYDWTRTVGDFDSVKEKAYVIPGKEEDPDAGTMVKVMTKYTEGRGPRSSGGYFFDKDGVPSADGQTLRFSCYCIAVPYTEDLAATEALLTAQNQTDVEAGKDLGTYRISARPEKPDTKADFDWTKPCMGFPWTAAEDSSPAVEGTDTTYTVAALGGYYTVIVGNQAEDSELGCMPKRGRGPPGRGKGKGRGRRPSSRGRGGRNRGRPGK